MKPRHISQARLDALMARCRTRQLEGNKGWVAYVEKLEDGFGESWGETEEAAKSALRWYLIDVHCSTEVAYSGLDD